MKKHSFLLLASLIGSLAVGDEVKINSADEFIQLKENVSSGTTYEGTTVLLDSDLDLTGKTFEPIGSSSSNCFRGVFDGQGNVISNLAMDSSSRYAGLFGVSYGLAIRNVVLDSSCSITSSYSGFDDAYVGGIIGNTYAGNGPCTIENSVNMARVSFTGNANSYAELYLGGIAGFLKSSSSYEASMKNCANYGDVTHSGRSYRSYIGGVAGYSDSSSSSKRVYIYNSLNYGAITYSGTTSNTFFLGEVTGYSKYINIENCVSAAGKIEYTGSAASSYIGSIVGYAYSDVSVSYCYFTSELSTYSKYGTGTPSSESNVFSYDSATFELSEAVTVGEYTGTSLISALNAYADTIATYSHWLLNKNSKTVAFTINGRAAPISMSYQIILTPSIAGEGSMVFDGWYEDSTYTTPLTSYEVTSDTALYSQYGIILTVTFDKNGGESVPFASKKVALNDVYGELPETTRTGYTFNGWFTEQTGGEQVESGSIVTTNSDHTLYAHWTINQYTLTFETNGGSKVDSITEDYNKPITLPEPTKTGYTFAYWCSDSGLTTEYKETTMPAESKTLYAKWIAKQYTITFDFNNGTVSSVVLDFDAVIEYPENMTRVGFTFGGWDSKPERMPAENITVKAQWTINQYTITFDFNNGTVSSVVLDFNITIEYLEDMTREGFAFTGWSPKPEMMPAENVTVTAQWTINQYTVTFDFGNGTVSSAVLDFDAVIEYPEDMTRVGFTFGGWDSKPERMPAENITVKAQWTINQYTITFDFNNGTVSSAVLDYDAVIEYPKDMTRVGFTFGGWDSKPERMPAENITVTAQWNITDPVKYVEVMFSKEGMTEEEARKVVEELVPEGTKFSVTIAESDSEGTKVVVKFNNAEAAKEFVETVSASSEAEKSGIKAVEFSSDDKSFATSLGLSVLASFLAYLLSF